MTVQSVPQMSSRLPDADMQAAPAALLRAAQRARQVAARTGTPLVYRRDGRLIEERVEPERNSGR
ncbi:MAG: hypothetical protein N3C63_05135 [Rhodocyclaceae bacterium]|nr:hypothetical protein [Rhodocyclaceae bacterium]